MSWTIPNRRRPVSPTTSKGGPDPAAKPLIRLTFGGHRAPGHRRRHMDFVSMDAAGPSRHGTKSSRPPLAKQLERHRADPAMGGVAVIALMPVLGDLDTRQCGRRFECRKAKWPGET